MPRRSRRPARPGAMARRPDRAVPAYDRWVRTEEVSEIQEVRRRRQARGRLGQRALARRVAATLSVPAHELLHVLNLGALVLPGTVAQARPMLHARRLDKKDPTHLPAPATPGQVRGWFALDELALTLIGEAGEASPIVMTALLRALRTIDEDPEARPLARLALALWDQPLEWRRRLRHCDNPSCEAPYFLAHAFDRRDRHCIKSHEQRARRGRRRIQHGRSLFQQIAAALVPGRLAPPSRPSAPA
jgi:hypothetical protein